MGETRVDLLHLLEDLRDAYPGSLEETILTEIVANALDSGAGAVALTADPTAATLTVGDDGHGMSRVELRHYHDVAASSKVRGTGIGFAGIGIKLGLLACEEVLTETRRGKTHVASSWRLTGRYRAPWQWVTPPGAVAARGTAVRLKLANALSPLLEAGFLAATLQRHFRPLFDPTFEGILAGHARARDGGRCWWISRATSRCSAPSWTIGPVASGACRSAAPQRTSRPLRARHSVRESLWRQLARPARGGRRARASIVRSWPVGPSSSAWRTCCSARFAKSRSFAPSALRMTARACFGGGKRRGKGASLPE